MMVIRKIFLFAFLLGSTFFASAQKAERLLQEANTAYADLAYFSATRLYEHYHAIDSTNIDVIYKLADCYWNMREYDNAKNIYSKISIDSILLNPALTRRFAELCAMNGDYKQAAKLFSHLNDFHAREQGFIQHNRFLRDSADWTIQYLNINTQQYREFSPMLIGSSIIWSTNEPRRKNLDDVFASDGNGFIRQKFLPNKSDLSFRNIPQKEISQTKSTSLTDKNIARVFSASDVAIRTKGFMSNSFFRSRNFRINQPQDLQIFRKLKYNVVHATASEGASKIYLTVNDQRKISKKTVRKLGIVEADIMGNFIANPVFVPISSVKGVDSNEVILHGAIDPMGKYLVFSSNRVGGKGGYDLYVSIKSLDGKWSAPEALESLNSAGDEVFSAFSSNGDLYFSSNGRAGLGGLDIYKVKTIVAPFSMTLLFEDPEHLSYPINSNHDDFGFVFSENGQKGYFTSDRYGTDDIFSFEFKKRYVLLSGSVIDRSTGLRAEGIIVSLYEAQEDGKIKLLDSVSTDRNGVYTFLHARPNKSYIIKVYNPTKGHGVPNFTVIKASTEPNDLEKGLAVATIEYSKTPTIEPLLPARVNITSVEKTTKDEILMIQKGETSNKNENAFIKSNSSSSTGIGLGDKQLINVDSFYAIIYFGFDLDNLTQRAVKILDSVVAYMKANLKDEFILLGHADEVGDATYNMELSKRRVFGVTKYIASKGINTERLKLYYYGEQKQAQSNTTPKHHLRLNRRVEFILVKK